MNLLGLPNRIDHTSMQVNHYKIRLNCDITSPEDFTEELNVLDSACENDSITLLINTNGGVLDTAVEFLASIDSCEAHVHAHITSCAHSAGSMIFLKAHSWSISKYATMLIHCPNGGFVGKFSDNFQQVDHFRKWVDNFYRDVYEDFLTDEEITDVLNGKDLWLDANELEERLIRLSEIRQEKTEKELLADLSDEEIGEDDSEDTLLPDSDGWFENTGNVTDEYEVPVNLSPDDRVQVVFRDGSVDCDKAVAYNWTLVDEYSEVVKYRLASDSE